MTCVLQGNADWLGQVKSFPQYEVQSNHRVKLCIIVLHFANAYQFYFAANVTSCNDDPGIADGSQTKISYEYILLLLGQLINGYTSTVLFVLGVTYIDQSVPADVAPLYVGE